MACLPAIAPASTPIQPALCHRCFFGRLHCHLTAAMGPWLVGCRWLQATKHHPSSVDLELIKRLASSTNCTSLAAFLSKEFDCIRRDLAGT